MTWGTQTENLTQMWSDVQKTMWQGWYDMFQATSTANPMMFNQTMLEQWRQMATQSMEMWTSDTGSIAKSVSSQFIASQAAMMRIMEMTIKAWQAMAPRLDAGENWQEVLNSYTEQFRQQITPQNMMDTIKESNELWQAYMQQMQSFSQPWMQLMQRAPGHMGSAMAGNGSAELIQLTQLFGNVYDQTLGQLRLSPSIGFTRELEEKIAKALEAWKEAQQANYDYQLLLADAWSNIYREVMETMITRAEQGKPIESIRDLMRLWTESADKSFDKIFRTDAYAEVQGRFVAAAMNYRVREQAVMDDVMKAMNLPNRSEVDEAHRNIYELRKEVKALKKQLKQSSQPAPKPKAQPAAPSSPTPQPTPQPQG